MYKRQEELLEKYKDDERINMICGMNHLGHYDKSGTSYIFTKTGAITGWASWKRVIDTWDPNYSFVDDEYQKYCLKNLLGKYYDRVFNTDVYKRQLLYTPWMIHSIGRENFGLYTLAMSVISLFVFDFGLRCV